eukprot:5236550-Prymnesium_polylepis.4
MARAQPNMAHPARCACCLGGHCAAWALSRAKRSAGWARDAWARVVRAHCSRCHLERRLEPHKLVGWEAARRRVGGAQQRERAHPVLRLLDSRRLECEHLIVRGRGERRVLDVLLQAVRAAAVAMSGPTHLGGKPVRHVLNVASQRQGRRGCVTVRLRRGIEARAVAVLTNVSGLEGDGRTSVISSMRRKSDHDQRSVEKSSDS